MPESTKTAAAAFATTESTPLSSQPDEAPAETRDPWDWARAKGVKRTRAGGAIARAHWCVGHHVTEAEFDAALAADSKPFVIR